MGWSFPFCKFSLKPGADTGFQKEISPSADGDQPARLDRAGSQTRTRLSHTRFIRAQRGNKDSGLRAAGGIGAGNVVFAHREIQCFT